MRGLCVGLVAALLACGADEGVDEASPCGPRKGAVARVIDGDTVELSSGVKVRYLLIDTPEIAHSASEESECFGDEAKAQNTALALGKDVELEYDVECTDRFGRTLAYVYVGERMINATLVERGYARVLVIKPNDKHVDTMRALEQQAKASGAGMWGACVE